jgi:Family of unknown function (DUF6982)
MANLVVARFADGRTVKGNSLDVDPTRPQCHVRTADGEMVEIALSELKALFFVRTPDGNPEHEEGRAIEPADPRLRGARLIEVTFKDGETVVGLATRYPPNRQFFFIVPVDPGSNNVRVLINQGEIAAMTALEPPPAGT